MSNQLKIDDLRKAVALDGATMVAARAGVSERTVYAILAGQRDVDRLARSTKQGLAASVACALAVQP